MARAEITEAVIVSAPGQLSAVIGASVQVNVHGGGAATVYLADTGGTTVTNPLTSDSAGRINGWLEPGSYDLVVSKAGMTGYTQPYFVPADGATGAAGSAGVGANWRGVWSSGTTYAVGDGVYRNGLPYIGNSASNLNHDPISDTGTNWGALFAAPLGVDVWNTQSSPASVTDWGAIVNALLAGGTKRFLFGGHNFPFTTKLNAASLTYNGIVFEGLGAGQPWTRADLSPTRLIWKGGAGSGNGFDFSLSDGVTVQNLAIIYDNAAYNGDLIKADTAGGLRFLRCVIGDADNGTTKSARSLLSLNNAVGFGARDCTFTGAQTLIRGRETGGANVNQISFSDCMLQAFTNFGFVNPGEDVEFSNCCWEFPNCGSTAFGIGTDITNTSATSIRLTDGCTFWDWTNVVTQGVIKTLPAYSGGVDFIFENGSVHDGGTMTFGAPGSVKIEDVTRWRTIPFPSAPYIDMGTTAAGAQKESIVFRNRLFDSNGTGDLTRAIANLDGGHRFLDVQGPRTSPIMHAVRTGQGFVVQKRGSNTSVPTWTMNAAQTGLTLSQSDLDSRVGLLHLTGTAIAGLLGTVVFSRPLFGEDGIAARLHVLLSAIDGYGGSGTDPETFYNAQIYPRAIGNLDLTGFEIRCKVGWTSKQLQLSYQVTVIG